MSRGRNLGVLAWLAAMAPGPSFTRFFRGRVRKCVDGAELVGCSRCGAEAREPCDPRTLGAWLHHRARADAWMALSPGEQAALRRREQAARRRRNPGRRRRWWN